MLNLEPDQWRDVLYAIEKLETTTLFGGMGLLDLVRQEMSDHRKDALLALTSSNTVDSHMRYSQGAYNTWGRAIMVFEDLKRQALRDLARRKERPNES